jgi:hypothetical protein
VLPRLVRPHVVQRDEVRVAEVQALGNAPQLDVKVLTEQLERDFLAAVADGVIDLTEPATLDGAFDRVSVERPGVGWIAEIHGRLPCFLAARAAVPWKTGNLPNLGSPSGPPPIDRRLQRDRLNVEPKAVSLDNVSRPDRFTEPGWAAGDRVTLSERLARQPAGGVEQHQLSRPIGAADVRPFAGSKDHVLTHQHAAIHTQRCPMSGSWC